ncbi:hypothetical protein [Streptomyces sp. MBT33]|nr:hypothetical protein [Streptomyces sp. MBT33]MBK3642278.1 hypothetical protein [Streptomyces sp. MBT33]
MARPPGPVRPARLTLRDVRDLKPSGTAVTADHPGRVTRRPPVRGTLAP